MGSLTITLSKPLQQPISDAVQSTSPLSITTDRQASEDVQKACDAMSRINEAPKITAVAATETTVADDDGNMIQDHEKDDNEDALDKNLAPQVDYAMNIDRDDEMADNAQGTEVEDLDITNEAVEASGELSNDEDDHDDEDDNNGGVLLIDERETEEKDESTVTTEAQAAAINALSMLANTATVFKSQHRESDSGKIIVEGNEMEEYGEAKNESRTISAIVDADGEVKGNHCENIDVTDTGQHETQDEDDEVIEPECNAEPLPRMTTRRRNSETCADSQHQPPNGVRVVLKGSLVPRPSIAADEDEGESDTDQMELNDEEHHERRSRREVISTNYCNSYIMFFFQNEGYFLFDVYSLFSLFYLIT